MKCFCFESDVMKSLSSSFYQKHVISKKALLQIVSCLASGLSTSCRLTQVIDFFWSRYPDVWSKSRQSQNWIHTNNGSSRWICRPEIKGNEWREWLENFDQNPSTNSKIKNGSLSWLQSQIPKICNADGLRREYELEWTEHPKPQCANPMEQAQGMEYCWFIENSPSYSWHPFVPILISNLLPNTRYLTILRNPVHHVWSNYFHFGGGTPEKMQLSGAIFILID